MNVTSMRLAAQDTNAPQINRQVAMLSSFVICPVMMAPSFLGPYLHPLAIYQIACEQAQMEARRWQPFGMEPGLN